MIRPETSSSTTAGEEAAARYRGVRKRAWGKWVSEIRLPNSRERIWLGSYDTPEKAARAFDAAMFCLRGRSRGRFNFPHDVPDIPRARSLTPPEIQAAAARFAHEGQPSDRSRSRAGSPALSNSSDSVDGVDWSFWDSLEPATRSGGGGGGRADFGFPAINDFPGEFFPPPPPPPSEPPNVDYDDGGSFFGSQPSYLWNF